MSQPATPPSPDPVPRGPVDRLVDKLCGPERNAWRPQKGQGGSGEALEALAIAVLAALLLKFFAVEAYQIPTSSMQPTLMGSSDAGVYDRILVDKTAYLFRDPVRWDVGVFRYPLQKNQSYVKRVVGVPGDKLRLRSGNVLTVDEEGVATGVLFKPDRIQEQLWRQVYPLRREIRAASNLPTGNGALDGWWKGRGGDWSAAGEVLKADIRSRGTLTYTGMDGGLVNHVWDGYPAEMAVSLRDENSIRPLESVIDARIAVTVTPPSGAEGVDLELLARRPGGSTRSYKAEFAGGQLVLSVRDDAGSWESSPVPCDLPPGQSVRLRFAMRDGRVRAWREGTLVAENDLMTTAADGRFLLLDDEEPGATTQAAITPRVHLNGKGQWTVTEPTLERDLHYTWRNTNHEETTIVEVPEDRYWMLGDNTLQSVDSRGWKAITVAVDAAGNAVDPATHPDLPTIRGNKRPMPFDRAKDPDETPIALPSMEVMVMIDEWGERHRLRTRFGPDYGVAGPDGNRVDLRPLVGENPQVWSPPQSTAAFVPREHFQGRALAVFWPIYPFWRMGFVR